MQLRDQSKGREAPPPVPQVSEQLNYVAHSSIISVNAVRWFGVIWYWCQKMAIVKCSAARISSYRVRMHRKIGKDD